MQNAGQYGPGAVSTHQSQFIPTEPSLNSGSITSSLRQFRKKDVDKSSSQKSEAHVARVAPQNHYPPMSSDCFRYPQFPDYSVPSKYEDIPENLQQSSPMSTSVIQKAKPMDICNVQPQHMKPTYPDHLNSHQQYSPDNGQYHSHSHHSINKDPTQLHMGGFKPESHYYQKDQHHYQPSPAAMQPKFNSLMATQNIRKFNVSLPRENPFLNQFSKINPSMARSIIADHQLQESSTNYPSPIDQRAMFGQQNNRYYPVPMYQSNHYLPNTNYPMNNIPPAHYSNYPSPCNYSRPSHQQQSMNAARLHSVVERGLSPARRVTDNLHNMQRNMNCHNVSPKIPSYNYSPPQYNGPEYAQHYQHRRPQEVYQSPPSSACRAQYLPNHHEQIAAQEIREYSTGYPSDRIKKFIENWAEEEIVPDTTVIENSIGARENNLKTREDLPTDEVVMVNNNTNNNEVEYLGNEGIPVVAAENGLQLSSEQYQFLVKNGVIEGNGFVRVMEANTNQERVVNLHITESPSSDCMLSHNNKTQIRSNEMSIIETSIPKPNEENKRVVIHQNTVINSSAADNSDLIQKRISSAKQQNVEQVVILNQSNNTKNSNAIKELVDKNCSPINLDHFETNLDFSESLRTKTTDKIVNCPLESVKESKNAVNQFFRDFEENCIDDLSKSPKSKSMPLIMDFFADHSMDSSKNSTKKEDDDNGPKINSILMEDNANFPTILQNRNETDTNVKQEKANKDSTGSYANNLPFQESSLETIELSVETTQLEEFPKKELTNSPPSIQLNSDEDKSDSQSKISDEIESVMESMGIEIKTETDNRDSNTINSTNAASPDGRKKRIFSVDDIIYNIGSSNNKQSTKEETQQCSIEDVNKFLEEEIGNSSLNQILINYENLRLKLKKIDSENAEVTLHDTNMETDETDSKNTDETSDNLLDSQQKVTEINSDSLEIKNMLVSPEQSVQTETATENTDTEMNDKQSESPSTNENSKPTNAEETSEDIQYRDAIRVEENSVLLEIAGEFLEINVNNINGKKVITVVSLSNTAILDVNDNNYEMSVDNLIASKGKDAEEIDKNMVIDVTAKEEQMETQTAVETPFDFSTDETDLYFDTEESTAEQCNLFEHEDIVVSEIESEYNSVNEGFNIQSNNEFNNEQHSENLIDKALNQEIVSENNDDTISDSDSVFLRENEVTLPNNNMDNSNSEPFDMNDDCCETTDEIKSNLDVFECPCIEDSEILVTDEIILTDPLGDDIGLIEEVDKCSSDISVPLEPVVTTSEIQNSTSDKQTEVDSLETNHQISNCSANGLDTDSEIKKSRPIRPEVVILSPTSTNLEDTNCPVTKKVYSPINDGENDIGSSCFPVTTKAAKKSYENELQIHSVTTSGDVEEKQSEEMVNYQNDSVSSSEKVEKLKEISSSDKNVETKGAEPISRKRKNKEHHQNRHHSIKVKMDYELKTELTLKERKMTHTDKNIKEQDEEFVNFSELVKARNLRKLRKMQSRNTSVKIKDEKLKREKQEKIENPKAIVSNELKINQDVKQKQSSQHKEKNPGKSLEENKKSIPKLHLNRCVSIKKYENKTKKPAIKMKLPTSDTSKSEVPSTQTVAAPSIATASPDTPSHQDQDQIQQENPPPESPVKTESNSISAVVNAIASKRKISWADYVSRKRKASCEDKSLIIPVLPPPPSSLIELNKNESIEECVEKAIFVEQLLKKADQKECDKNMENMETNCLIKPNDTLSNWESPIISNSKQSKDECLIDDSSGLICRNNITNSNNNNNNCRKPVVDVNELISCQNRPDVKLQEYKDKVDLKLSSLNIQIPKIKPVAKIDAPENSALIKRFLNFEKMTPNEMEKIKQIISYKKYIEQKNARLSSSSSLSGKSSTRHSSTSSSSSSISSKSQINNQLLRSRSNSDQMMKLHLKKVNGKRKMSDSFVSNYKQLSLPNQSSSAINIDDYSVVNRLGKNGQPKIILKRNKQQDIHNDDDKYQPIVRLQRIDLNTVKEKFNITINQTIQQ